MILEKQKKSVNQTTKNSSGRFLLPVAFVLFLLFLWWLICYINLFPAYALPTPLAVAKNFTEEFTAGRMVTDIIASMRRVVTGFTISACLDIPVGMLLGQHIRARQAFVPVLNFFRFL